MPQYDEEREERRRRLQEIQEDYEARQSGKPKIKLSKKMGMWLLLGGFIAYAILTWGVRGQRIQDVIDAIRGITGG